MRDNARRDETWDPDEGKREKDKERDRALVEKSLKAAGIKQPKEGGPKRKSVDSNILVIGAKVKAIDEKVLGDFLTELGMTDNVSGELGNLKRIIERQKERPPKHNGTRIKRPPMKGKPNLNALLRDKMLRDRANKTSSIPPKKKSTPPQRDSHTTFMQAMEHMSPEDRVSLKGVLDALTRRTEQDKKRRQGKR